MHAMLVQVHKWVNVDSMLQNCLVGPLSGPVTVPKPRPPTPKQEESIEHSAGLAVGTRVTILPSFHMSEYRGMHGRVLSFESDSTRIRPPASLEHCFRFVRRSLRSRYKSLLADSCIPSLCVDGQHHIAVAQRCASSNPLKYLIEIHAADESPPCPCRCVAPCSPQGHAFGLSPCLSQLPVSASLSFPPPQLFAAHAAVAALAHCSFQRTRSTDFALRCRSEAERPLFSARAQSEYTVKAEGLLQSFVSPWLHRRNSNSDFRMATLAW